MISRLFSICVVCTVVSAFKTGKLNRHEISTTIECDPNRIYRKDDVTCFCNEYGQWPHQNCSLVFDQNRVATCKPGSYIQVDCNVCRCSKNGIIEKEFCTNHICSDDPDDRFTYRRFTGAKGKCDLNHWYMISNCRLCFCITKENLLCAPQTNTKKINLGRYNLTDCGAEWLTDINKLLSSVNPLRLGEKGEKQAKLGNEAGESVEGQVIFQVYSTPKDVTPQENVKSVINNEAVNVNREVKIARNDDKSDNNDQESNVESDSEENIDKGKQIARITGNTVMPFENDEENDSNNSNVESDRKESDHESVINKKESDNESEVNNKDSEEVDVTKEVESAIDLNKNEPETVHNEKDRADNSLLKLNLPGVLGKVFNFGLRKSMVTLTQGKCVPRTTIVVDCNTCFCLNNGKMLCTKKKCE